MLFFLLTSEKNEAPIKGVYRHGYFWVLKDFLPGILEPERFHLSPARVTDRSDPKIVHLDGLNLSRAWNLFHISNKLQGKYPHLTDLAWLHLNASLPHIASGHYEGEHWLASFAVYAQFSQFE